MRVAVELKKIAAAAMTVTAAWLGRSAVAVGADGGTGVRGAAAIAGAAAARDLDPIQEVTRRTRSNGFCPHHRSSVIGTPTGGGKYPFLVVMRWQDGVHDPRDTQDIYCQGTMIAPDVVLTSWSCRPDNGFVMVGDSSNSSLVQFRNVVSNDTVYHGLVSHPNGYHHLFQIEPVTFQGFYPATINKDPGGVFIGQEVTVVGYGANDYDSWPATVYSYPGEAHEAQLKVIDYRGTHFDCIALGVGPCRGDLGAPVLDESKSLIGITNWWNCGNDLDVHLRVSHVADWIERNACALSARKRDIPFCPDLVCPTDARLLGYPWALLPNGTASVVGIHGFVPVRATQWPPPGTPLFRGSTTNVTITAFDAVGRNLECLWQVLVAPLVELAVVALDLPIGTYTTSVQFSVSRVTRVLSGRVYKMSGRTSDQLRGSGSSVSAYLRRRGSKYTGRALTLERNRINGSVLVPNIPLQFGIDRQSDVKVRVNVTQNAGVNKVSYKVYGQAMEYLF